jgi:CHAD domain-containing protein
VAYRFDHTDTDIAAGLRRIAGAQLGNAIAALTGGGDRRTAVHSARKAIKKTRALIRLVRPGFPAFKCDNAALRDIGRRLAPLRDADVSTALLDTLCDAAGLVAADRGALRLQAGSATADNPDAQFRLAVRDLEKLQVRAARWKLTGDAMQAVARGTRRTAEDTIARMRPALDTAEPVALHDFRKRVKDRWYHARLLCAVWPEAMAVEIAAADALSRRLGDHEDLHVLSDRLAGEGPALDAVRDLIRSRRGKLLAEVRPLAGRVCAERPEALSARWIEWWRNAQPPLPSG